MEQVYVPKGSLVKVYFKNGTTLEGIVVHWNDKKGVLQAPKNNSRMIVYNPAENVMMLRLFHEKEDEVTTNEDESAPIVIQQSTCPIKEDNEISAEVTAGRKSMDERTKRLVEHRLLQASQSRQQLAKKLRDDLDVNSTSNIVQSTPNVETTYYAVPNFSKPRTILSSRKEEK